MLFSEKRSLQTAQTECRRDILYTLVQGCDVYTRIHMQNVAQYARVLVKTAAVRRPDLHLVEEAVVQAAALHDVGKRDIPSEILLSPGKLTTGQRQVVRQHPVLGARLLIRCLNENSCAHDDPLDKALIQGALYHHERWDGTGYPFGLKGEQIPIAAQIVALADAYDALTGMRPYKQVYSHEKALSMLLRGECGSFSHDMLRVLIGAGPLLKHCLEAPEKIPQ